MGGGVDLPHSVKHGIRSASTDGTLTSYTLSKTARISSTLNAELTEAWDGEVRIRVRIEVRVEVQATVRPSSPRPGTVRLELGLGLRLGLRSRLRLS